MPRKATGQLIAPDGKQRSWALRFRAYSKRRFVSLGTPEEGWSRERAEAELRHVLADVERGIWRPREPAPAPDVNEEPTFHEFASEWFEVNRAGWAERTATDYRWALAHHLLPHFARHRLSEITVEEVDRYRAMKLREDRLGPAQINKTLKRLSQILELAEEYEYIARNPARGRRRRAKAPAVRRSWVEPEQALSLVGGASTYMRPVVASLIGAGLRVSELVALDWADVSLATGTVRVGKAKTAAGAYREIDLSGGLVEELAEWKMRGAGLNAKWRARHPNEERPIFLSAHAGRVRRQSAANVAGG
jgi:integrase